MKRTSGKRNATNRPVDRFLVLYDGWPLAYAPGSPAALHLLEIITALPGGVEPWVALPFSEDRERTRKLFGAVSLVFEDKDAIQSEGFIHPYCVPTPDTPGGRLRWQQRTLPGLARHLGAKLVHTTGTRPALLNSVPVIVSPADLADGPEPPTFAGRLGVALGRGGLSGARAVLWPADLPDPGGTAQLRRIPPYAHHAFQTTQPRPDSLPESYVLAAGPLDDQGLELLSAAWSWAQDGLGEDWALVIADLDDTGLARLRGVCQEAGITGPVERGHGGSPELRAALFQHAGAVLALGPVLPWGDALLQALACARPLVAEESALADARTGPAAYLTPRGDARALGAALITVIVEEDVSEQLGRAARSRAAAWGMERFSQALAEVYGMKKEGELA